MHKSVCKHAGFKTVYVAQDASEKKQKNNNDNNPRQMNGKIPLISTVTAREQQISVTPYPTHPFPVIN
jgi:hypothetical protein